MKLLFLALAVGIVAAPKAAANETAPALQLRPKSALVTTIAPHQSAPFVAPTAEPELDLLPRPDPRQEQSRSSCSAERNLCYDPVGRRIVYKPARELMPDIPGFTRENISVKRDRIVFRYSF